MQICRKTLISTSGGDKFLQVVDHAHNLKGSIVWPGMQRQEAMSSRVVLAGLNPMTKGSRAKVIPSSFTLVQATLQLTDGGSTRASGQMVQAQVQTSQGAHSGYSGCEGQLGLFESSRVVMSVTFGQFARECPGSIFQIQGQEVQEFGARIHLTRGVPKVLEVVLQQAY